jgi:hypothetical protein
MDSLFDDMPSDPSPRLKWMEKHRIVATTNKDGEHLAFKSETRHFCNGPSEIDAVVGLAKKLKLKLWNEN